MFDGSSLDLDVGDADDLQIRPAFSHQRPNTAPDDIKMLNLPSEKVIERKFPGPAGILLEPQISKNKISEEELWTQTSLSMFQKGPWLYANSDYENLLEKFTIKWIRTSAHCGRLHNSKAPFLGAVIENIEVFSENEPVFVMLKDMTGEIPGTMCQTLYEEYSNDLTIGAVIILRQFSVLTTENRNVSITITANNLVTVYTTTNGEGIDKMKIVKLQEVSREDFIKTISKETNIEMASEDSIETILPKQTNTVNKEQARVLQPNAFGENKVAPQMGIPNIFEDDFVIPEECLEVPNKKKKFNFKKKNLSITTCSRVSDVNTNEEDSAIWRDALEGIDVDTFFQDFS